jgi:SAM-dependent methyltransferase
MGVTPDTATAAALARLYDLDLVDDPGDLDLYLALAARAGGRILELGGGTGRLASRSRGAGHRVTGVDNDPAMLERARAARGRRRRGGRARTRRERRGRTPPPGGARRFRLAFLALNSIMVLGSRAAQRAAVQALADHLEPGGIAVVDAWLPDADDLAPVRRTDRPRVAAADAETGALVTKAGSAQHDAATGTVTLTTIFEEGAQGEPRGRWVRRDRLRLVSADELGGFASAAGLDVELIAGGYDLEPLARGGAGRPHRRPAVIPSAEPASPGRDFRVVHRWVSVVSSAAMASSDQTRLLVVEDVPQVAQYIRGLLNAQAHVKLLDVLTDGTKAVAHIRELRPDVVLVDASSRAGSRVPISSRRSARSGSASRSSS